MNIKTVDGNVLFSTHLIRFNVKSVDKNLIKKFDVSEEGIFCFSETEKGNVEKILSDLGVSYTTKTLIILEDQKNKVDGIKYSSRTEALEHILNNKEPKHIKEKRLEEKLNEKEKEIEEMKLRFNDLDKRLKRFNI